MHLTQTHNNKMATSKIDPQRPSISHAAVPTSMVLNGVPTMSRDVARRAPVLNAARLTRDLPVDGPEAQRHRQRRHPVQRHQHRVPPRVARQPAGQYFDLPGGQHRPFDQGSAKLHGKDDQDQMVFRLQQADQSTPPQLIMPAVGPTEQVARWLHTDLHAVHCVSDGDSEPHLGLRMRVAEPDSSENHAAWYDYAPHESTARRADIAKRT